MANIGGPAVLPVILALVMFTAGSYLGLRIATLRSQEAGVWPPRVSVLLALVAIAEAGFLAVWSATAGYPSTAMTLRSHRPVFGGDGNPDRGGPIA